MMGPHLLTWEIASLHDEGCEKILTEGSGWAKLRISELTTRRRFFFLAWWEFEHPRPPAHWGRQERFGAQVRAIGCWVLLRLVLLATSNLGSLAKSSLRAYGVVVPRPLCMRKALGSNPRVSSSSSSRKAAQPSSLPKPLILEPKPSPARILRPRFGGSCRETGPVLVTETSTPSTESKRPCRCQDWGKDCAIMLGAAPAFLWCMFGMA